MVRLVRRAAVVPVLIVAMLVLGAGSAFACGGLVAPGHAEVLQKATTLVAWHAGLEHYVTGFQFAGSADRFGYIIPLPGVPTKIQKGGDWTLERLEREINPAAERALLDANAPTVSYAGVQVIQKVTIDALDITIVRGGGPDVATWAAANGFDLTPDTPQVMSGYSSSGAIFALAKFNRGGVPGKGVLVGQGEVIHFTIPTKAPWVPLQILALGKSTNELVDADLFVISDNRPAFAPAISEIKGMAVKRNEVASTQLLSDLRSDRGMSWLPATGMWFTALKLHTTAGTIDYDLSINGGGPSGTGPAGHPIPVGLPWPWWLGLAGLAALVVAMARVQRPTAARVA